MVVLYTLMSLDGAVDHPDRYFAQPDGPIEVPEFDEVMEAHETRVIGSQDTVLLGRGMYDEWSRFWPTAQHQPFAAFINEVPKVVVTSTPLTGPGEEPWQNAEAAHGPLERVVADLRDRAGGDIGVHGSITLAHSLLAADLVDELQLVVGPAWGCTGRRLFPDAESTRRLELVGATPTPSSSLLLTYRARR
ncbi:MAG: dihydrofolate reductase family protein [Nocardioides sp.]